MNMDWKGCGRTWSYPIELAVSLVFSFILIGGLLLDSGVLYAWSQETLCVRACVWGGCNAYINSH